MKSLAVKGFSTAVVLLLLSCTRSVPWKEVGIKIKIQAPDSGQQKHLHLEESNGFFPPLDPLNLECFFLNVTGPGITSSLSETRSTEAGCIDAGALSRVVSRTDLTGNGISVKVRAGYDRKIQLIGVAGTHVDGCNSATTVDDVFDQVTPFLYEIGSTTTNLLADKEVTIQNTYSRTDLLPICTTLNTKKLAPLRAYRGYVRSNSPNIFPDILATGCGSFPLISQVLPDNALTSITLSPLSFPIAHAEGAFAAGGSPGDKDHARFDFLFPTNDVDSNFTGVEVEARVAGGTPSTTGSCGSTIVTPGKVHLRIYDGSSLAWHSEYAETVVSDGQPETILLQVTSKDTDDLDFNQYGDGVASGRTFLHVSIREENGFDSTLSPSCSMLELHDLQLRLIRP